MAASDQSRAVVIGSGPNGLAAAILLARAGVAVTVHEAAAEIGGGARTAELTLPGYRHDVCSAIHPMAACSPCFEQFPLAQFGLEWIQPDAPLAHPLDDGSAIMLERSLDATAANLGPDGPAWRALIEPIAAHWSELRHDVLAPFVGSRAILSAWRISRTKRLLRSARGLADSHFRGVRARAHSSPAWRPTPSCRWMPCPAPPPESFSPPWRAPPDGLWRAAARSKSATPWPDTCGSLGGEIRTGSRVDRLLLDAPLVMCDITPRQLLKLAGTRLPGGYREFLARYRDGPGVFKLDLALDGPIPWRAEECLRRRHGPPGRHARRDRAMGGAAIPAGRSFCWRSRACSILLRAPAGKHTVWAYCHVPHGSTGDFTDAIEQQIERFAPGFRSRILARSALTPALLEARNANLVGGDVAGGSMDLVQTFLRPNLHRYRTPLRGVYLCSSSTPPGGGVHGMCGYHAVQGAFLDKLIHHPAV